ncbi:MAG: serine hydrolase domain-containing protein [Pseudobacter sp.]|uniref:serine hydrolase domain-containing protein n=1 Tax=Pseudobacter sp. TaxID=2045420 RepID=UPI003F7F3A0B
MKHVTRLIPLLVFAFSCGHVTDKEAPDNTPQVTALTNAATTASKNKALYLEKVKQFVDSNFKNGFNGSILVAKDGEIIYEKYGGFANPRVAADSITEKTPIHLASISKTFTGMAICKLWEEGKVKIDDSVGTYLPGFPLTGVTVRMLLNHRSGIPKYDHYMGSMGWDRHRQVTNEDVLSFLIENRKRIPCGTPNRGFSYSNTNYALLALIIEKVSGKFYGDYLKQTFFDSIGMKDTYVFSNAYANHYLPSYFNNGKLYPLDFLDLVYGDKNIYSTPRDLMKWDEALRSGLYFNQATLEAAYTPYSNEKPGTHNYGLGWRMYVLKNGKKLIYHNGWWHGNRTAFYRLIDENATIIALCNNDSKKIYRVREMADIFGDYMQRRDEDEEEGVVKAVAPVRKKAVVGKKKPAYAANKSVKKKTVAKRSTSAKNAAKAKK